MFEVFASTWATASTWAACHPVLAATAGVVLAACCLAADRIGRRL